MSKGHTRCVCCRYWEDTGYDIDGLAIEGLCRRRAPATELTHFSSPPKARWPLTDATDWCGEGKER